MFRLKLIISCLYLFHFDGYGQPTVKWTFNSNMRREYDIADSGNKNLFDSTEIKQRKIKTVYLIEVGGEVDEDNNYLHKDTFIIYKFNSAGRTISETCLNSFYSDTNFIDLTTELPSYDSIIETITFNANDSILTRFDIWKFDNGYDTAFVNKRTYNKKGRLVDEQRMATIASINARICMTGAFKHYKYDYDDAERLSYLEWFKNIPNTQGEGTQWESMEYMKFSYPFYGKLIETYNSKTNEIIDKEVVLINNIDGVISETDRNMHVTTEFLAKGSKLINHVTIVNIAEGAYIQNFDFVYSEK